MNSYFKSFFKIKNAKSKCANKTNLFTIKGNRTARIGRTTMRWSGSKSLEWSVQLASSTDRRMAQTHRLSAFILHSSFNLIFTNYHSTYSKHLYRFYARNTQFHQRCNQVNLVVLFPYSFNPNREEVEEKKPSSVKIQILQFKIMWINQNIKRHPLALEIPKKKKLQTLFIRLKFQTKTHLF